ncbi:MAG: hypothetical protein ABIN01_21440 [Ferruginibacter sp.]
MNNSGNEKDEIQPSQHLKEPIVNIESDRELIGVDDKLIGDDLEINEAQIVKTEKGEKTKKDETNY